MKLYKTSNLLVLGRFPYVRKLVTYQYLEHGIRFYYLDRKIGLFKYEEFTSKDGEVFSIEEVVNEIAKLKLNEYSYEKSELEIESDLYEKRILDGVEMSKDLMAELRINSKENGYPRAVNKYIEDKLDKVKINIDRGWWVTALEELEATTVESYFSQDLYDRIHTTISGYITNNY